MNYPKRLQVWPHHRNSIASLLAEYWTRFTHADKDFARKTSARVHRRILCSVCAVAPHFHKLDTALKNTALLTVLALARKTQASEPTSSTKPPRDTTANGPQVLAPLCHTPTNLLRKYQPTPARPAWVKATWRELEVKQNHHYNTIAIRSTDVPGHTYPESSGQP
ncbi:unnamed protein product [Arctogadus glacialis]